MNKIWMRILLHATDEALSNVKVKIGGVWHVAQQEGFRNPVTGRLVAEDFEIEEIRCQQFESLEIRSRGISQ